MIILMMMVIKNDDNDDESYTSDKSYTCVSGDVLPVPMAMAMIFFNSVQEKYIQEGGGHFCSEQSCNLFKQLISKVEIG